MAVFLANALDQLLDVVFVFFGWLNNHPALFGANIDRLLKRKFSSFHYGGRNSHGRASWFVAR